MPTPRLREFLDLVSFPATAAQLQLCEWLLAPLGATVPGLLPLPAKRNESLLLLGRAAGKSSMAILTAIARSLQTPGMQTLLASPTVGQSTDVLLMYARQFLEPLRDVVRERTLDLFERGSTTSRIAFRNGSELTIVPNKAARARGYGPRLMILDEVASWQLASDEGKDLRAFVSAIKPRMLAQHKQAYEILYLTTPGRACGPVWEWYTKPPADMAVVRASTMQLRPDISPSEFSSLRPSEYAREIMATFSSEEDSPAPLEFLDACELDTLPEPDDYRLVIACDPGFRQDFCGFCVASKPNRTVIVHELRRVRFKRNVEGFVEMVKALNEKYPGARIILDQFSADALMSLMSTHGIDNVKSIAWTAQNRDGAFEKLRIALEDRRIMLPRSQTAVLREELAGLRITYTATGHRRVEHGAAHDDQTFALLLALVGLEVPVPRAYV